MVEVQFHGFSFEKWVRENLFEGYTGNYMQEWDIPPDYNRHPAISENMRGIPVSVKSAKYGSPIGLGDINRQRAINQPFLMIVGFWKQRTPTEKWIEEIGCALFLPVEWNSLWGALDAIRIREIDLLIKDHSISFEQARQKAKEWKKEVAAPSDCHFVVNPKIDSKSQRRIQCSLPFREFWNAVGREPSVSDCPMLFDHKFSNPIVSKPRKFNRG